MKTSRLTKDQQQFWDVLRMPYNISKSCGNCKWNNNKKVCECPNGCYNWLGPNQWKWNGKSN